MIKNSRLIKKFASFSCFHIHELKKTTTIFALIHGHFLVLQYFDFIFQNPYGNPYFFY